MMKLLMYSSLFALVSLVFSKDLHPRGCIYIDGICSEECEVGTHSYTTDCGPLTPEPTCDEPNPKPDEKRSICDYSECYCDPPTVRHVKTKKCVPLDDCKKYD